MGNGNRRTTRTRSPAYTSRADMATRCHLANLRRYRINTERCHMVCLQRQCNIPFRQLLRHILSKITLGTCHRAPRNTLPLHHRNTHRTHYGSNSIRLPLRLPITREHGTLRHRARHHTSIRQRFRRSIRPNSMPAHICRPDTMRKCPRMDVDHPASSNRGSTMLRHARNSLRLARHLLAAPRH